MFTIGCHPYKTVYSSQTMDNPDHLNFHTKEKTFLLRLPKKQHPMQLQNIQNIYIYKLSKIIKAAEKAYYVCKFDDVKSDIKQTWKLITTIINNNNNAKDQRY